MIECMIKLYEANFIIINDKVITRVYSEHAPNIPLIEVLLMSL